MTTREVAEFLRIKERKVYDLVKARRIPCTRVTGKWLFPRRSIDAWLAEVAPPFDPTGNTALVAATLMYEILCIVAESVAARRAG